MTIQAEQARRLETIRKLLAKAEDQATTVAEAESLSAKAAELMQKYAIDQAMLDAAANVTSPQSSKPGKRHISFAGADYVPYRTVLLNSIALAYGCQTVRLDKGTNHVSMVVFGFQSDIEMTDMLFTSLTLQAANALLAEDIPFGETPRSFMTAWWSAYVDRIYTRLQDMRAAARAEARKTTPGTAVVLKERKDAVSAYVKQEFPDLTHSRGPRGGASRAGREAGDRAGRNAKLGSPDGVTRASSRVLGR